MTPEEKEIALATLAAETKIGTVVMVVVPVCITALLIAGMATTGLYYSSKRRWDIVDRMQEFKQEVKHQTKVGVTDDE